MKMMMPSSQRFVSSIAILLVAVITRTQSLAALADQEAQTQCKTIHHTDVELDSTTAYLNSRCLLNCNIHGKVWSHFVNEGLACSGGAGVNHGICREGSCIAVDGQVPTASPNGNAHLGHIDIEMESASLASPIFGYAMVCVQNFTQALSLPLSDRSSCTSCTTSIQPSSTFPVWHSICSGSGKMLFSEQSRVTFEVFDNYQTGAQVFVGGASLTIPQLLSHGDNHRRLHLALVGGHMAGQINARVTWTPLA